MKSSEMRVEPGEIRTGGMMENGRSVLLCVNNQWKRKVKRALRMSVGIATVCLYLPCGTLGQGTTGTLRGQILDPSGAVVPEAQVTITNQQTGVVTKVLTSTVGTYNVPSLLPGLV